MGGPKKWVYPREQREEAAVRGEAVGDSWDGGQAMNIFKTGST